MHGGHIGTENGSWCDFPDGSFGGMMGGGHMGGMHWSDSVYCDIDEDLPGNWSWGPAVGYHFTGMGSDGGYHMGHGHGGMMSFNNPVTLSLCWVEGYFPDENNLRLWKYDGTTWMEVGDADINTVNNRITVRQDPLFEYYVIAASAPTSVTGTPAAQRFQLEENYPNPFHTTTTVRYSLRGEMPVRIAVYDVAGRLLRILDEGTRPAGTHVLRFDAASLPSGAYLLRLSTPAGSGTRMMEVVR
jgi:hypothetical protein